MPNRIALALFLASGSWLACEPCLAQGGALSVGFAEADLVPEGASWRFFRGTAEPSGGSLAWTQAGFEAGAWEAGEAGFGYDDGDDRTILSDMRNRYSTVYIRKEFEVPAAGAMGHLELIVDYDDGFVAFLNGVEVARAEAGLEGTYPPFDGFASGSHEAGTAEVFRVGEAASLLVEGRNVLAVVGLNSSLDSMDFSLHPRLRSRAVLAGGCPGEHYISGTSAILAGRAPMPLTAQVLVDGEPAALDPATGDWSLSVPVPPGSATFSVEARDSGGVVIASGAIKAIRARSLGGRMASDTTLTPSGGPLILTGRVAVAPGIRLTIEAGCVVLIGPGGGFDIEGEIKALGTIAAPITFTRLPCGENWGSFVFDRAEGESTFRSCEWSFGTGSPGCLTLTDSALELDGCTLRDIDGEGVHATGGKSRIRRCLTERTHEALSLDSGDTVVELCTVRDAIGDSDLIDSNGSTDPPARIAYNVIHGTSDDGIDVDRGNAVIEGNVISACGDQAISLVGTGSSVVRGNICFRNGNGLSVKDSHETFAELNTFVWNTITGVRAIERTVGRGGGRITIESSIVWGNTTQLLAEAGGFVHASFCDVEGPIVPGAGNINADPLFADPSADDFRLTEDSPCIGAGGSGQDLGALPFEGLPLPPTHLLAEASGMDSASISWRDSSRVEDGYEVERAANGGGFQLLVRLPADSQGLHDEGLAPGTTYGYRVRAYRGDGFSPYAGPVEVMLTVPAPVITAVEPDEGPSAGGTAVIVRGRNFHPDAAATLGGVALSGLVVIHSGEIRGITPGGAPGPASLEVSTPAGEDRLAAAFTYFDLYLRGDATGDGIRDISDAVSILNFLFTSGPPPPCQEVADINRDGKVDISDPVSLLLYLFGGGPAPEPDEARCAGDDPGAA